MTLEEIDRTLGSWRDRLRRADENLVELESESAAQLLTGKDGRPLALEGLTRERVGTALEAMQDLFEQRARLNEVLAQAQKLRDGMSRLWTNDQTAAEIQRLLRTRSVELSPVRTPLALRGLLTEAETGSAVAPEDLLTAMLEAFDRARDAVLAVGAAWKQITALQEKAERQLGELDARAQAVGEDVAGGLYTARQELDAIAPRVLLDPLGSLAELERGPLQRLATVSSRLDQVAQDKDQAQTGLQRALRTWDELRKDNAAAGEVFARCAAEVEDPGLRGPTDAGSVEALGPWLEKIRQTAAPGRWRTAAVGVARWLEAADGYLSHDRRCRAASESALARREELLGRLLARRAQAEALAAKGIKPEPSLEASATEAEQLLRRKPAALGDAEARIASYEAWVIARSRA